MRPGPKRPRKRGIVLRAAECRCCFNEAGAEKAPETLRQRMEYPQLKSFNEAGAEKAPETW